MVTRAPARARAIPRSITRVAPNSARGWSIPATCRLVRRSLWPWQTRVARLGLARAGGRWRFPLVVVTVPRQSGKTLLDLMIAVDRCLAMPGAQVWYTAQSRMDAVLRWRELVRLLRASPLSECQAHAGHVRNGYDYRVRGAAGAEEIEFANGSQLRIFAPAEDSLHGSTSDLVILDEARFLAAHRGDALIAAVLPTQATRDGQVWITSTAGDGGSTFLARQVEIARAALEIPDSRVAFADYGIGADVPAGNLLDAVWRAHPAAGRPGGPVRDALAVAAEHMPGWQFAHEYGNRWRTEADERVIPPALWSATETTGPPVPVLPTFAADVAPDRSESTICACADSTVELVDHRPGAHWVADRLLELDAQWAPSAIAVDAAGPAGTVADALRSQTDRLVVSSTNDLANACAAFYDALEAGTVRHRPHPILDTAAARAVRRSIGQRWVWSRVDGGPALVAASLAFWASSRRPVEIERSQIW